MKILGIDPGLSGALAILDCEARRRPRLVSTIDVPTVGDDARRRPWCAPITEWLVEHPDIDVAFVERAQAMPDQGASSGFIYGRATGYLEAIVLCSGITLRSAEPSVWKRRFGLIKKDKAASLALARTFVDGVGDKLDRAKDEHRAEAMLIAAFGGTLLNVVDVFNQAVPA